MRIRLESPVSAARLPSVVRGAGLRLISVCFGVWAVGMLSPRLTPHQAGVTVLVGAAAVIGLVLLLGAGTHRILRRLRIRFVDRGIEAAQALLVLVRSIGLLVLSLGFFLFWTLVYLGVWWWHPASAFRGLDHHPYFSEFFYYAVSTAFISPPGDILAHSRGARTATMVEIVTGAALLSVYLGSFVDLRASASAPGDSEPLS
ncbi:MAG: hypothetical protein QOH15_1830 [Gaiellales bacterium]|nr:hypothetical protein [Gaiellales bacterium]